MERLRRIRDRMAPRGPDGEGLWLGPTGHVGLAHRRLAIIDLSSRGAQPMSSSDGSLVITFNGEIYNYRALKQQLERLGHSFRTDSDTEVLLHLWDEYGADMVHRLRGMYAFALWDQRQKQLFLARDPYGIKPLYMADDDHGFWAASQVRALLAGGGIDDQPDPAGHAGFFLWGHVPDPVTLFRGIRALPAGCTLTVTAEGPGSIQRFADIPRLFRDAEAGEPIAPEEVAEEIRAALLESVQHHLVSDVEVGIFLSSGLDSVAVAGLTTEAGAKLRSLTIAFSEYRETLHDEAPLAERAAAAIGTRHTTVAVQRTDFEAERERLFDQMDQPSTDGLNTYLVSRAAHQAGLKVALSGLGGDEIFCGYPSFRELPRLVALMRLIPAAGVLGRGFRVVASPVLRRLTSPKYAGVIEYGADMGGAYLLRRGLYMPWELPGILGPDVAREGWEALQTRTRLNADVDGIGPLNLQVAALEASWYMRNQLLRDTDWASMAHSLEVRVPLVDWHLLQRLAPLIARVRQPEKAELLGGLNLPMPPEILNRPKTGFTTPVRQWLIETGHSSPRDRGLRGWAHHVYDTYLATV